MDDSRLAVDAKRAGDKAGKAAGTSFRQQMSKMTAFKQGIGQGLGIGAFNLVGTAIQRVTGYLGDAAQAYREDEASQQKLRASLEANIPAWNGNADAIESVLESRIKLGFSDDEQRASLATLVTRTHDYNKALGLQRVAMDLARLRGIDLGAATDLLGKAFSGQVGALRKAGIAVDDHATAQEALQAVMKATSGQAEAFAETDLGRVVVAETKAAEASEKFGKAISKVTTPLQELGAETIETFAWAFDQFSESMDNTTRAMEMLPADATAAEVRALADQMGTATFKSGKRFAGVMKDGRTAVEDLADGVDGLTDDMGDAEGGTKDLRSEFAKLTDAADDAEDAIDDLADTVTTELFGDAINAGHLAKLRETHDELVKQRKEAKKGSREYQILTGEIAENEQALFDLQLQMKEEEGPDAVLDWLRKQKAKFGDASGAIQRLIDKYKALDAIQSKIGPLPSLRSRAAGTSGAQRYAEGGRYAAGVPRIVGENGPEFDIPDHSGYIVPNPSISLAGLPSASSTNTWGGTSIHIDTIDARGATDPAGVGRAVYQVMDKVAQGLRQESARLPVGTRR